MDTEHKPAKEEMKKGQEKRKSELEATKEEVKTGKEEIETAQEEIKNDIITAVQQQLKSEIGDIKKNLSVSGKKSIALRRY